MAVEIAKVQDVPATLGQSSQSSSNYVIESHWSFSNGMDSLLDDSGGVQLFYLFLSSNCSCGHLLDFWFACKGFRSNLDPGNPERLFQVAKVIYRTYIKSGAIHAVPLPPTLKHEVANRMSSYYNGYSNRSTREKVEFDRNIFDGVQDTVKRILEDTYYPKFVEYVKGLTASYSTIPNTFTQDMCEVLPESARTENEFVQPTFVNDSPRTKSTKGSYRGSTQCALPHQKTPSPGTWSHCSPPFSPAPERHQPAHGGGDSSSDSCCPRTATPNPDSATAAAADELDCCCCWCCGCFDECPRLEGKAAATGEKHPERAASQDPGLDSGAAATSSVQKSKCLPVASEEVPVIPSLGHQKSQSSDAADKLAPTQPVNHPEDAKECMQTITMVTNLEKPESFVPTEPNQGEPVMRPNLAQTDPALFVLLLTKRLEKVKEVHEKMEKLRSWVSQVDEKSHVSSSLIAQDDVLYPGHMNHPPDDDNQMQSIQNRETKTRPCDQVFRSTDTDQSAGPPWSQNLVKSSENKTVTSGIRDLPAAAEDDAQGILDDHCSRIWADENKSTRRISHSTSRRSRAAMASVHDGISDRYCLNAPTSSSRQRNQKVHDTTLRRNSSTARTSKGCSVASGAPVGRFCTDHVRACALPANSRSDARSTTSWDSGVAPELACSSNVYCRRQQQPKQRTSRSYNSAHQPWSACLYQQKSAIDRVMDDDTALDNVFPQAREQHRQHGDLDAASLQALSSSTTELAIVNSEVTAKLVQHMARQYNRSSGTQRAHSSHDHAILPVDNVSAQMWPPNPVCRALRDCCYPTPGDEVSSNNPHVASSCVHYTATSTIQQFNEHTNPTLVDCRTELDQVKLRSNRYPPSAISSQHVRSTRTRVFPTPSDTSSTFDSGISSTYDQLSLGDQDNRSRRLRQWHNDGRNLSTTTTTTSTNYSRTPSAPRGPGQVFSSSSSSGNQDWQQAATATPSLVGSQHHHNAYSSHQTPHPLSTATTASTGGVSSCAYCHPAPCQHLHHLYHRPHHVYHHRTALCQSANNGSVDKAQGNYTSTTTCSSTPGGGQLLQHWLAYQQQQSTDQSVLAEAGGPKGARGPLLPPRKPTATGQHRRSLTTGHRHRQKASAPTAAGDEEFAPETTADDQAAVTTTTSIGAFGTSSSSGSGIIVGYYLCDDPVPYRTVWTGSGSLGLSTPVGKSTALSDGVDAANIAVNPASNSSSAVDVTCQVSPSLTLGQFKQLIAKKGSYRYFFKKPSNEFGTGVVHEELTQDDTLLPLWDGKVVARVERVD